MHDDVDHDVNHPTILPLLLFPTYPIHMMLIPIIPPSILPPIIQIVQTLVPCPSNFLQHQLPTPVNTTQDPHVLLSGSPARDAFPSALCAHSLNRVRCSFLSASRTPLMERTTCQVTKLRLSQSRKSSWLQKRFPHSNQSLLCPNSISSFVSTMIRSNLQSQMLLLPQAFSNVASSIPVNSFSAKLISVAFQSQDNWSLTFMSTKMSKSSQIYSAFFRWSHSFPQMPIQLPRRLAETLQSSPPSPHYILPNLLTFSENNVYSSFEYYHCLSLLFFFLSLSFKNDKSSRVYDDSLLYVCRSKDVCNIQLITPHCVASDDASVPH